MSTLKQKLKQMMGWGALLALVAGLILPALISIHQAKALDLEFNFFDEEQWCADHEDSWVSCSDSDSTSFVNFDGEFAPPEADGYAEGITQTSSAREFVVNVTNFVLSFLGLAAVVVIIYGGFLYVTAAGEQERADQGKKSVMYAIMGIIIVLISYALVNTIIQGAAGGEDVTSSGGLYSSGGVSSESLTAFQSEAIAKEIQAIGEEYMAAYTTYVNVAAILDAMANIGYFGEEGLSEYKEGFDLIDDQVDSLSSTHDIVQEATIVVKRYISSAETGDIHWGMANFLQLFIPEVQAEDEYTQAEEEEEACKSSCKNDYSWLTQASSYWSCLADCSDELSATETMDPYEVGSEMVSYVADISWNSYLDFQSEVADLQTRLETLQTSFSGLTTIDTIFDNVIEELALYQSESAEGSTTYTYEYLADNDSHTIGIPTSPPDGSSRVAEVLEYLNELHVLVKDLEFTTAIITANTKSGNAPLTVTFNGLDSYDPTEQTIDGTQYHWDLLGDGFESDGIRSFEADNQTGSSVTYTYADPGTYRVALRVDSSSDTEIASGISYLSVKVNPPSSVINLKTTCGLSVSTCDEQDQSDVSQWTITKETAASGITFDASDTTDGSGNYNTIVDFSFDFGDGESESGESSTATHYYTEEGTYNFELEVTDQNGVKDRKYLRIKVASPAADIQVADGGDDEGEIGDKVTFTAEGSQTDNGSITTYEWYISDETGQELNGGSISSNNPELFTYTFNEAGIYTVGVAITDAAGFDDEDSMQFTVNSGEPSAAFDYKIPDSTHPNRVHFDGSASQNPDNEGDDNEGLTYKWSVDSDSYSFEEGTDQNSEAPIIDFSAVGDHEVTLTVYNNYGEEIEKSNSYTRKVTVDSILNIEVETTSGSAVILGSDGTAQVELSMYSDYGVSFEVDWADDTDVEVIPVTTSATAVTATHKYDAAGTYPVSVKVYDEDNKTNQVVRNVYIGNGEAPIPIIRVYVDNVESADVTNVIGNRESTFRFDAGDSLDYNGNSINSTSAYSWDFGDGSNPAKGERLTHVYKEVGEFEVILTVKSDSAPTPTASITTTITIENLEPVIYSFTVTPNSNDLVTPLTATLNVNADDPDSNDGIASYKFWYYDINNSSQDLDTQITTSSESIVTVNTNGTTGESKEYGFVVEVTDSENNTVSSIDALPESSQPTLEVENGTNISPVADFTVERTSIMKGDTIVFTSSSYDEDGSIESYIWDIDGDGFYNDGCETDNDAECQSSRTVTYDYVAKDGIDVQLKVTDDGGATDTSDEITIYIDTDTEDPVGGFNWGISDENPLEVWFKSTFEADANNNAYIDRYEWDFNLSESGEDGDNNTKNDIDSTEEETTHVYDEFGAYSVGLTVYDNEGNSAYRSRTIDVKEVPMPVAAFSIVPEENDGDDDPLTVHFENKSYFEDNAGEMEGVEIVEYVWDFNTAESNGNNATDGDTDSTEERPEYTYDDYGTYEIKLTVKDNLGRKADTTEKVTLETSYSDLEGYFWSDLQDEATGIITTTDDSIEIPLHFGAYNVKGTATFCIDRDLTHDSNDNGNLSDDCDPVDKTSGVPVETIHQVEANSLGESHASTTYMYLEKGWTADTNYENTIRLTVTDDLSGEVNNRELSLDIDVVFEDEEETVPGAASTFPVTSVEALYILAIAFGFTLIGAKIYIKQGDDLPENY